MLKSFLSEAQEGVTPNTWWSYDFAGHNKEATLEVKQLFDGASPFDTPKPVRLIRRMLELFVDADGVVMDFFAGSCTTAQSVLEFNREVGGDRRFIMVQLPESTPEASVAIGSGFTTIAEVGKERIRRVIKRMQAADAGKLTTGLGIPEDLGFRVFKLDRSNYKAWRNFDGSDVAELQTLFDRFESPLVEGWQAEDVLVEVMLMEGFPLDSATEPLPELTRNTVTRVSSDLVAHRLFVCLDAVVYDETIAALGSSAPLAMGEDDIFICLDSALTDEAKVRLEDGRRVKVI